MYCLVSPALSLLHHKERVKCALILVQSKLFHIKGSDAQFDFESGSGQLVFRTLPAVIVYIYMRRPYLKSVFS